MKQKNKSSDTKAMTMEEYLTRRKEIRSRERDKERGEPMPGVSAWAAAELNI